ncbi:MAG: trypsin-like serine protease [Bdellovibrionales bacterium]|nr:trypsin-like serine protease [Bdellovibrionales bacterium]
MNQENHLAATGYLLEYQQEKYVEFSCSSVFISPTVALTAAHCIRNKNNLCITTIANQKEILFEEPFMASQIISSALEDERCRKVKPVSVHSRYLKEYKKFDKNDMALLELEDKTRPVENFVPVSIQPHKKGERIQLAGYGYQNFFGHKKSIGFNYISEVKSSGKITIYSRYNGGGMILDIKDNAAGTRGDSGAPIFNEKGTAVIGLIKSGSLINPFLNRKQGHMTFGEDFSAETNLEFLKQINAQGYDVRFEN